MTAIIYQLPTQLAGTPGVYPNFKYMVTGDNVATMTAAGYLNSVNLESAPVTTTDVLQVLYSFNKNTGTGTYGVFTVSITNGVITLTHQGGSGEVVLPTIANHIATYTNTDGTISEDPATAISGGNIQAGLSGTAGTFISYPGTASKGSLILAAVANTGNTTTTISNNAMAQASVVGIPDPGNATGQFLVGATATPFVNGNFPKNSGTAGLMVDSGIPAANVVQTGGTTIFQAGSQVILAKTNGTETGNAVTASGNAGQITTSSLTTAGGASYAIAWTNTQISTNSVILISIMGGTNTVQDITVTATSGSGTSTLTIFNNTAATPLNGTIILGYVVL